MVRFVTEVEFASSMNRTDINHVSETLLIPLFAEIYGYKNLKNLNYTERKDFPGIDLGDETAGVAFQITATPGSEKIKDSLTKFVKYKHYERFNHLVVYIISKKQDSYVGSGFDEIIDNKFTFDKDTDIRDSRDILRDIYSLQIEQLLRIEEILEANLGRGGALWVNRLNEPVAEGQYLKKLLAELESFQGVQEHVELSATGEVTSNGHGEPASSGQKVKAPGLQLIEELMMGQAGGHPVEAGTITLNGIKEAVEKLPKFVLLGEPGGGKTTTVRRLAYEAAHERMARPATAPLPLLLDMVRWREGQTVYDFIRSGWSFNANPLDLLARGEVTLYLDGLDAMGERGAKNAERLRELLQSQQAPRRALVTCREYAYTAELNLELPIVRAKELDERQIEHFARNYLGDKAEEFLQLVLPETEDDRQSARHLCRLARNPYLLTALIEVHQASPGNQLPRNTGTLLNALVRGLWERELKRGAGGGQSLEEVMDTCSRLAFSMIKENLPSSVPVGLALRHLKSSEVLRVGCGANIIEQSNAEVRFYHQLLQEYFAAVRLSRVGFRRVLGKKPSVTWVALKHVLLAFLRKEYWKTLMRQRRFGALSAHARVNVYRDFGLKWYESLVMLCDLQPQHADKIVSAALESNHLFLAGYATAKSDSVSEEAKAKAVSFLLKALRRGNSDRRDEAAQALGLIADDSVVSGLIEVLKHGRFNVQLAAVGALTQIGGEDVAARLLKVLRDESASSLSRARAAQALGRMQYVGAVPDLLSALKDENWRERWVAAIALGQLKERSSVPGLVEALSATGWHGQWTAAWALGNIGDEAAVPALLSSMRQGDVLGRYFSAVALGEIRSAQAVPDLIQALSSDLSSMRGVAAWGLGRIRDPIALPDLEALSDDAGEVEWLLENRLTKVRDEVEEAIRSILVDRNR